MIIDKNIIGSNKHDSPYIPVCTRNMSKKMMERMTSKNFIECKHNSEALHRLSAKIHGFLFFFLFVCLEKIAAQSR